MKKLSLGSSLIITVLILVIVLTMPFYGFIEIYGGYLLGDGVVRSISVAFAVILLGVTAFVLFKSKNIFRSLTQIRLVQLALGFALLNLVYALIFSLPQGQELEGLLTNTGYIGIFIIAIIASLSLTKKQTIWLSKGTIITVSVAASLGLLQLLLPHDFLSAFGYSESTVSPYIYIKDTEILRIFGPTGGPNQLGAMLLLPIFLSLYMYRQGSASRRFTLASLSIMLSALFFTHSRTAWMGLIAGSFVWAWIINKDWFTKQRVIFGSIISALSLGILVLLAPKVPLINSVLLHGDEGNTYETILDGSTAGHIEGLYEGVVEIAKQPLGRGIGAAGPASQGSENPIITESYFLQLGVEMGVLGLGLFVYLTCLITRILWDHKEDPYVLPVFLAFIGLNVTNLFLHTWGDATTAIVWWGVAGLLAGRYLLADAEIGEDSVEDFSRDVDTQDGI